MVANGWSLEVVRGREPGRSYPIDRSETVVGNALAGLPGIDLAAQEGDSPRRMAARQTMIESTPTGLTIRDLDSPGGTFINRQRILPGQSRPLIPGDMIQIGSVQLRLVGTAVPNPKIEPFAFRLAEGTVCRSWDDFLRVSSQRWDKLRDELTSGRLDAWLRSIRRDDLIVAATGGSPDDHLDAWLARIPTTRPAAPELDVHPTRLLTQVTPGGGTTMRTVQITNVGHRLLRVRVSIDPPSTQWLKVADPFAVGMHHVVEAIDVAIEITIPEALPKPLKATIVVEGNGGSRRVEVVIEAKTATGLVDVPATETRQGQLLEMIPIRARILVFALCGLIDRVAVAVGARLFGGPIVGESPGLFGPALFFAIIGGLWGVSYLGLRRGARDAGFGAISGGIAGVCLAAVFVAICRTTDSMLGLGWGLSILVLGLLSFGLASLGTIVVPVGAKTKEIAQ